jgi:predicted transcriptional regulator
MMREMWGDSMKAMNCSQARITYEDFLLLMKGQTRDAGNSHEKQGTTLRISAGELGVVIEEQSDDIPSFEATPPTIRQFDGSFDNAASKTPLMPNPGVADDTMDTPLSMDDNEDIAELSGVGIPVMTTVVSPLHARCESSPPVAQTNVITDSLITEIEPTMPMIPKPRPYIRARSRSYDETNISGDRMEAGSTQMFSPDSRCSLRLPEHDKEPVFDHGQTAVQPNRKLYRAHRQMRLAVMDASNRFEEQQARHARDVLIAQQKQHDSKKGQAGLVMRRVENKTVSTEQVRKLLEQNQKDRLSLMEAANRRSGRRNRTKTISDIGGMLGSLTQEEISKISEAAPFSAQSVESTVPEIIETSSADVLESNPRGATVPGEFRKVNDPFGAHGRYGHFS